MDNQRLIFGDCLDVLPGIESASVDLVFADPPFNVGVRYGENNDKRDDYAEWCAAWIAECFRVLKDTGTFYLMTITRHLENLYPAMKAHGVFINQANWKNVASANNGRSFWNDFQPILVYGKTDNYKFNRLAQVRETLMSWDAKRRSNARGQLSDYWNDIPFVYAGSITHKEAILKPGTNSKAHPAQMPVGLAARAILFSTDEGDTVLDPFNGSGTTGEACYKLNRRYIGIEKEREYYDLTLDRWRRLALQPLFRLTPLQADAARPGEAEQLALPAAQLKHGS